MTVELRTKYLGLELAHPLVASAGPLTGSVESLRRLEEAGAAAAVLPSLFEEQLVHEEMELHRLQQRQADANPEGLSYFPEFEDYNTGPEYYVRLIAAAREALAIPVIASLNGSSKGGWIEYAAKIADAGAHALELNIYFVPSDPTVSGEAVEARYLELVSAVRQAVALPLAVKIGPYFSSLPHFTRRLVEAGADGLVLFNRFLHPDIDLETLEVTPSLVLSRSYESRLAVRWMALLRPHLACSLAATGGAHQMPDVLKLLLAGADVVMMTSALLQQGPGQLGYVLAELETWLEEHEYESVEQLRGSMSAVNSPDPSAFERANYTKALLSYTGPYGML